MVFVIVAALNQETSSLAVVELAAYRNATGLIRKVDDTDWQHHGVEAGTGTYLYLFRDRLALPMTDGSSHYSIGLQLPEDLTAGQKVRLSPNAEPRTIYEIDVNDDTISRLCVGEFTACQFANPITDWVDPMGKAFAEVTINHIDQDEVKIHLRVSALSGSYVGPIDIDDDFVLTWK